MPQIICVVSTRGSIAKHVAELRLRDGLTLLVEDVAKAPQLVPLPSGASSLNALRELCRMHDFDLHTCSDIVAVLQLFRSHINGIDRNARTAS